MIRKHFEAGKMNFDGKNCRETLAKSWGEGESVL